MKKRTIQGFLAVTAMAWLGQPLPADTRTGQTQNLQQHERSASTNQRRRGMETDYVGFSAGDRALISGYLSRSRPASEETPPEPGARLSFDQLRQGRTLPPALAAELNPAPAVRDVLIDGHVVRVTRDDRRVVDVV